MSKPNKIVKNEEGSGLVLVLMVLMVLSVLGGMLGMVTVGSHQLAAHTQEFNSAYYIAESGANIAFEELKQGVSVLAANENQSGEGFVNQVNNLALRENIEYSGEVYFKNQSGNNPEAVVTIKEDGGRVDEGRVSTQKYTIESVGKIDGKERTVTKPVTIRWTEPEPEPEIGFTSPIDLSAALSYNYQVLVNNNNLNIFGDLIRPRDSSDITGPKNTTIHGEIKDFNDSQVSWGEQRILIYNWLLPLINTRLESIDFSTAPTSLEPIGGNNYTRFGDIIVNGGSIIVNGNKIEFTGSLITNGGNINFNNHVTVLGDVISNGGSIYFNGKADIRGDVISTGGEIMFNQGPEVQGSVITLGNGRTIKFGNGNTEIGGNVIANGGEFQFENNLTIGGATINPNGRLMSRQNVEFNGPVVVNEFHTGNHTDIRHTENYKNYFPFNVSGNIGEENDETGDSDGTGSISDIISSNPAIED